MIPVIFKKNVCWGKKRWLHEFKIDDFFYLDDEIAAQYEQTGLVEICDEPDNKEKNES